jgi:hypothetical protein
MRIESGRDGFMLIRNSRIWSRGPSECPRNGAFSKLSLLQKAGGEVDALLSSGVQLSHHWPKSSENSASHLKYHHVIETIVLSLA